MAVRLNQSGVIIANIGMMLLGIVIAIVLSRAVGWLWPAIGLPVFLAAVLSWGGWGLCNIWQSRGERDIEPMSPASAKKEAQFLASSSERSHRVLNLAGNIATILVGMIVAAGVGGVVGLIAPILRWPVFSLVFILWLVVGISVIVSDRKKRGRNG
jgi:hypothetical protein